MNGRSVKPPAPRRGREHNIDQGIALLSEALEDLVGQGLLRAPDDAFETLARRLVDAQAGGLAGWVHAASTGDPQARMAALGRVQLVIDTWRQRDALSPGLRADVRAAVGIALREAEVVAHGDLTRDTWVVIGRTKDVDLYRRLEVTRTWLRGQDLGRTALELRFQPLGNARPWPSRPPRPGSADASAPAAPTPPALEVGATFEGTLAFWPSAFPQRALIHARGDATPWAGTRLPGRDGLTAALSELGHLLALAPLHERCCVVLGDVRLTLTPAIPAANAAPKAAPTGFVLDGELALPWRSPHALELLSATGGAPFDLVAEWDGEHLRPLALQTSEGFAPLGARAETLDLGAQDGR